MIKTTLYTKENEENTKSKKPGSRIIVPYCEMNGGKRGNMDNLEQSIMEILAKGSCEIQIRNSGIFRFPSAYRFKDHNHKEIEINCIKSGHCIMGVEGQYFPLKEGDCMVVYPGVAHSFIVDTREKCSIAQLEFCVQAPENLESILSFLCQEPRYHKLANCEMACCMLESLCKIYRAKKEEEHKNIQMKLSIFQLFIELSDKITEKMQQQERHSKAGKMADIIRYINENYEMDINKEKLAEMFGISSRYIRKCFAEETGISCQHYINTLRIEKAKELLWFTSYTVTEIALKAGFNSAQYFCRVFQQYMEMSPIEYRNLWQGSKAEELCTIET